MKKIVYCLLAFALFSVWSCKKDSPPPKKLFENITYADIQAIGPELKNDKIPVADASNPAILKAGSIVFYKTNTGVIGKFQIKSISPQKDLTISLINYSSQGAVLLNKANVLIEATFTADLDLGVQAVSQGTSDFWWEITGPNNEIYYITPQNTALFYVYSK